MIAIAAKPVGPRTGAAPDAPSTVVVTNATGTFAGEMRLPDGTVIPPTGKSFDVEFGQTTKWDGDRLIVISAFWDAALQRRQLGLT